MSHHLKFVLYLLVLALAALAVQAQEDTTPEPLIEVPEVPIGPTLASVLQRGEIICAVDQDMIGYGYLNPNTGDITGINVDFCRAFATAIYGDAGAVQILLLSNQDPLELVRSGQVDILMSNRVEQTLSQDAASGLQFGATTYYDGQTFMVSADSGLNDWSDLDGATICTVRDSIAETSLDREMERREIAYDSLSLDSLSEQQQAFLDGRCSVQTGPRSVLEILRQEQTDAPEAYRVWEETFTRDSLSPVYRYGDKQWSDIITWTIYGLIYAEMQGITSENVDDFLRRAGTELAESEIEYLDRVDPAIVRFVDSELGIGGRLGLTNDFMVEVIRQVGNYGEIYQRHLGATGELSVTRTVNALWSDGGLIYAPDWR